MLKSSFTKFLRRTIVYIDSYLDQNVMFYQTINYFTYDNIEALTQNQVFQCVDMLEIKGEGEDCLFDEFTNIKSIFKSMLDQIVSIFDQVQEIFRQQNDIAAINMCDDGKAAEDDYSTENKTVRSDRL